MNRLNACLAMTLLTALVAATCFAQEASVADLQRLPKQFVFEAFSDPGQSMDDFALAIAPRLRAFSTQTGFEACGYIAQAPDGRYAVSITSTGSHLGCVLDPAVVPAGTVSVHNGIHSHGRASQQTRLNTADMVISGLSDTDRGGVGLRQYLYGQSVNTFSQIDLDGLPGYLATETGAIYHGEHGRPRAVVGSIPTAVAPQTVSAAPH